MSTVVTIAVDAMGGDEGPRVVIPGVALSLERYPEMKVQLFGDEAQINPVLSEYPNVAAVAEVIHTDVAVAMDDKPSQALRRGRRTSSMWLAIDAVKHHRADAALSAGNTGALMAMAKVILKTIPNVDRPAIAAIWPTVRGDSIVLDVGATIGADADQLVSFAMMGQAMSRVLYGLPEPSVGLLNIGQEEIKGLDEIKQAGQLLRNSNLPINYHGFVEGNDIGGGTVDVVVTEGFSGNIALKTAEGTARQITHYLRSVMSRTLSAKIGFFFARGALRALGKKLNARAAGGVFLGLNGIVVKAHGATDQSGFASTIDLAIDMAREGLVTRIAKDVETYYAKDGDQSELEEKRVSVS